MIIMYYHVMCLFLLYLCPGDSYKSCDIMGSFYLIKGTCAKRLESHVHFEMHFLMICTGDIAIQHYCKPAALSTPSLSSGNCVVKFPIVGQSVLVKCPTPTWLAIQGHKHSQ